MARKTALEFSLTGRQLSVRPVENEQHCGREESFRKLPIELGPGYKV